MAESVKIIRRTCTACQNVYKETPVSAEYFERLLQAPDVDCSVENDIEYINKTGCCESCLKDTE